MVELTPNLNKILPRDTKTAWRALVPVLPSALYLCGGTAVAAHLAHRQSRAMDLFYHENAVDLDVLEHDLTVTGNFSIEQEGAGTLRGYFGSTKLEILHSDQGGVQKCIEEPEVISGLRVAGLGDLAAMKVKAVGDRGQLRDYFDLKVIEEQGGISVEDAIAYYMVRFQISEPGHVTIRHIVEALGYLDDVDEDKLLPATKKELGTWWRVRQVRLIRNLGY
jgi:Nucleotidyl transferase AbiEii toxin, Type IV TA system